MRKFLLLTLTVLPLSYLLAQVTETIKPVHRKKCYTAEYLQQLQKKNPNGETTEQFEAWMSARVKQKRADPTLSDIINYGPFPVVFHVISTGQAEGVGYNILQSQIQAQVRQLNKDYANLSGSGYAVASVTGIQFCLATTSPNGTPLTQPGIDRVNATGKGYGLPPYTVDNFDTKVKPATIWDPTKYINIWVTEFAADEGILGYSTFPGSSTLSGLNNTETNTTAGVVIDYSTIGSVGSPSSECGGDNTYNNGKTLSHELGHYFGLRHIWGDATCATDYCDDTPKHAAANFGSPVHPKPNSCGTADEMFENYMDYCDDKVLNTFTLNQAERMQVVMVHSPRRKELATSAVVCSNASAASKVGFTPCSGSLKVTEKSTQVNCAAYTDVKIYLNIEDKATGAATLNVTAGGTATAGIDYEITNATINIAAGESFESLTVRIFDDAAKEPDETIILSYSITGNGVSASGTLPQTFTITISDDDNLTIGQNIKTIYSEDFGTTGSALPTGWSLLTSSSIPNPSNKWVVSGGASAISGQSLHISNNPSTKTYTYTLLSESIHIAETPLIKATNARELSVSFKYKVAGEIDADGPWDYGLIKTSTKDDRFNLVTVPGTSELVGTWDEATETVKTVSATIDKPLPASLNGKEFYLNFYWYNDDNTGTPPPLIIDDIVVKGKGTSVETELSDDKSIKVMAGDSNFIVSNNDDEILAAISNSSETIGCLNAVIQQAGTGQVDLLTNTGTYKRSEKVIKLTPAGGSNATYRLTLYFTTAELAGWPSITDLKVMKVQDGIALGSTISAANAVVLTPVVSDRRTEDGYASFSVTTTGFSQFILVSSNTTLPLQLITFNAAAVNKGAALNWNTGNEVSNKGFNIQRSLDGTNFNTIAFVTGKNQSANAGNYSYSYFDSTMQAGITYYYRLAQVDINGRTTFSPVRSVRLAGASTTMVVFPNPAKNTARVVTRKTMVASVSLTDAGGKIVWSMPKQTIAASGFDVPVKNLPAGVYMLWVRENQTRQSVKIVKE
jgi:zinc-dependent metalloproteinase lipoprotein